MDDEQLRQRLAERAQCERDHPISKHVPHNGFGWVGTRCPKCGFMFFGEWEGWVGEYRADYTPLTAEEINRPDPELDDLMARSRPVKLG